MKPRNYQESSISGIHEAFKTHTSTLLVLPTGGGKTIVFAHIIKDFQPARAMVLAHRNELIVQAREKIHAVTGLPIEIEKADLVASTSLFHRCPIVVSSIQTQIAGGKNFRRYRRFKPEDFGLLIIDEAHHAASKSWREVIAYYRQNPNLKVLGVTATPDRSDKKALGEIFESVAFDYGILDAIHDAWLVDITQQYVAVNSLDFSHVRTTAGDLNEGDLAKVMEAEENIQGVCQPSLEVMFALPPKKLSEIPVPEWREYLAGLNRVPRRTIVFTVSVAQAEQCANVFRRAITGVEWVCGKTNKDDRSAILKKFQTGEVHAVMNCGVLLEGFDNPGVELIVMARPTKSRALYAQAVGRSTRPLAGIVDGLATPEERRAAIAASPKPFARILDFVGNSGKHKLISCPDILGGHVSDEAAERAKKVALEGGKPVRIQVTMTNAQADIEREKREAADRARAAAEARKAALLAKVDYSAQNVDAFNAGHSFNSNSTHTKDGQPLSEKVAAILRRIGIDPARITKSQSRGILAKYFSKASDGQTKCLRRAGYTQSEIAAMDSKTASKTIDAVKANGWKRPSASAVSEPEPEYESSSVEEYIR
jgi:superfamily II DNA or RNA helicase